MQKNCCSFRSVVVLMLVGSLLFSPAAPVYARDHSEDRDITIPAPPGFPSKMKVTLPHLPHGIPVPVPVPGVPVFVEKHRERQRPTVVREHRSNRYDNRDYSRNRPDWRHDRDRGWYPRSHGSVHRSLPVEAFALSIAGAAFFFHMGTYYRHTDEGYVVVQAPLGARIRTLPERCSPLYIDGRRYYVCDDVYYETDGDEYIVIERPSRGDYRIEVGDEVRIKVESLNVRSGPGKQFNVVSQLYRGDVVEVGGMEGEWYYVSLPNGSYGWIMQEHVGLYRSRYEVKG